MSDGSALNASGVLGLDRNDAMSTAGLDAMMRKSDNPWKEDPWANDAVPPSTPLRTAKQLSRRDNASTENPWSADADAEPRQAKRKKPGTDAASSNKCRGVKGSERTVHLTSVVASLKRTTAAQTAEPRSKTKYELKGTDASYIKQRLAKASCKCKSGCHRDVRLKPLINLRQLFWGLQDLEREHLIRSIYWQAYRGNQHDNDDIDWQEELPKDTDPDLRKASRSQRVNWALNGVKVCFPIFVRLLGTSENSVRNWISGVPDGRRAEIGGEQCPAARAHPQAQLCHTYFMELYESAAEPLPEDPQCSGPASKKPSLTPQVKARADNPWSEDPWAQNGGGDHEAVDWSANGSNPVQAILNSVLIGTVITSLGLPKRYLPHAKPSDLYWMFVSWLESGDVNQWASAPCYVTFWRAWQVWSPYLKFRRSTQHSQCTTCWELQQAIHKHGASWADRVAAGRDLRIHNRFQYTDRRIYWATRLMSQRSRCSPGVLSQAASVLTIIIDTVDRAKFAWPRWLWSRVSKDFDKLHRPRSVLTAAIAHGYCILLLIQDENLNHGSDFFCDALSRTLDAVYKICQETRSPMPKHLVVQSDNTASQAKNQYAFLFLAWMVSKFKFWTVTLNFLMVGHTHEDVDQLFALLLYIINSLAWETPQELLDNLVSKLRPRAARKGEQVFGHIYDSVRDFATWLEPHRMKYEGAFQSRGGIESPHSFTFKRRDDLTASEQHALAQESRCPGVLSPENPKDVFICVKTYMRDTMLQQPPVEALPFDRSLRVTDPGPSQLVPRGPMGTASIKDYLKLAEFCLTTLNMPRASVALDDLVMKRVATLEPPGWLGLPGHPDRPPLPVGEPTFPHLPATSWRLCSKSKE